MSSIWYEKYRPQSIDEFINPNQDIKPKVLKWIENKRVPSILLSGIQGTGKSTLANILAKEVCNDSDILKLNASLEGKVDVIREKIIPFCEMVPFGNQKIVILEEADRLSLDFQKSLRELIEEHNNTVSFIFTCNYPSKIIPALHSRFSDELHFNEIDIEDNIEYFVNILSEEGLNWDDEMLDYSVNSLGKHIEQNKPDIRKIINSMQAAFDPNRGVLHPPQGFTEGTDGLEAWESLWSHSPTLDQSLDLAHHVDHDNYERFYRIMYDNIKNLPDEVSKEQATVLIALFLWRSGTVADQEMNLVSCLYRIFLNIGE